MQNTLLEISDWAAKLPFWEQLALDKLITSPTLKEADYEECLRYLLEDAELAPPSSHRPAISLPQLAQTSAIAVGERPFLSKLSNLRNINALKPNQTLTFGRHLTLIYGANGSGKSGYARLIASAAFTRGDKQILSDINQPLDRAGDMSAEIELIEGDTTRTVHYRVGNSLPELRNFYRLYRE